MAAGSALLSPPAGVSLGVGYSNNTTFANLGKV